MTWVRRARAQLICWVRGHDPIMVITGLDLEYGSLPVGFGGTITDSRHDCRRCGKEDIG